MDRSQHEKRIAENERQAEIDRQKTRERRGADREVERELQTVRPDADPPSRAGITGPGSGADSQR